MGATHTERLIEVGGSQAGDHLYGVHMPNDSDTVAILCSPLISSNGVFQNVFSQVSIHLVEGRKSDAQKVEAADRSRSRRSK